MKKILLLHTAVLTIALSAKAAHAADQAPTDPAGAAYTHQPTIEEELVYLRDIISLQAIRLDEAEQALSRQNALIEAQQARISTLEASLASGGAANAHMAAASGGVYVVKAGDTLSAIARRHNVNAAALAEVNNLRPPYLLNIGQRLFMPGGAPPAAAPAQPPAPQVMAAATPAPAERSDVAARVIEEQRQAQPVETASSSTPDEVGVRPDEKTREPYIAIFSDVGGILTPRGTLYAEPSIDYSVTSDNRFFFQGVEIVDAVLIGAIEATDSNREAITASFGARYGLTNRLEIDGRVSYVTREDRVAGVAIDDATTTLRELDGDGLGDVEFGVHYQLNQGRRFPYAILNLRAKAPTGNGPFDVKRDPVSGIETELATGSGYWTIEPSLTLIAPTDPAVIFANIGYQANLSTSPDAVLGTTTIREFDAGDAIRASIGVGLSLNERLSINFAYDQSYYLESETLIETLDELDNPVLTLSRQPTTTVGSFLFGGSYAVSDRLRINLNTAFGATDEAPDARISLRAQMKLSD